MKWLMVFVSVLSFGCTRKYVGYDLIRKVDFHQKTYDRPITVYQVTPAGKDQLGSCFSQWLFFSNAEKEKNDSIPLMVKTLCPGKDYLLQTDMQETWWTTIVFTRACVDIQTTCAQETRKK